jgi:hypothetical protein
MRKRQLSVTDKKQVELPPLQKFKVKSFKETIARTERISLNLGSTMVSQDFGTFNTRPEKFVGRDCDVINKVAYKPFPSWKISWPRSDFTISLSKFAERKPTLEVSSSA